MFILLVVPKWGDPCQLPPTVRSDSSSSLSVSLMERLAASLPQPAIVTGHADHSEKDEKFLDSKPTRQALSRFRIMYLIGSVLEDH